MKNDIQINWSDLLHDAVNKKGLLLEAYKAFYDYSLGNQMFAAKQCLKRDIKPSPLKTFNGWRKLNRQVKKGSKAIQLFMPVTRKFKKEDKKTGEKKEHSYQGFMLKKYWFLLSETEGEKILIPEIPKYNMKKALKNLDIKEIDFDLIDGNTQGFASNKSIAINPLAQLPHKTRFHEMAHIVLGHTTEAVMIDSEKTPKNIKEVEAESTAYILCSVLKLGGEEYCRGYIQSWLNGNKIPEKSVRNIFSAAEKILKAGYKS